MNSMIVEALRPRSDPSGALQEDPSESTRRGLESMTANVVLTLLISGSSLLDTVIEMYSAMTYPIAKSP